MLTEGLYQKYINNDCIEVWEKISFLDFSQLSPADKEEIHKIILETLDRLDYNFQMIYTVLDREGFVYENIGGINSKNKRYGLRSPSEYKSLLEKYNNTLTENKIPLLLSAFWSYFEVVDFRGDFDFDVEFFLDSFCLESPDFTEIEHIVFMTTVNFQVTQYLMFSPDEYHKENVSGGAGPGVILGENTTIDNYIVNYKEEETLTFINYLRMCVDWANMPNLQFFSEEERMNFETILETVRSQTKPF